MFAVLFDIYGTLLVSGIGEVGTARNSAREDAFAEALEAVGLPPSGPVKPALDYSFDLIEQRHEASRRGGVEFPEIDILDIWTAVLDRLQKDGTLPERQIDREDLKRLAIHYESRTNPTWPMPGTRSVWRGSPEAA